MKDVILEHLAISDIGPKGNFNSLNCSGLEDVTILNCTIEGWGGEAIDLVGCHRVVISDCKFTGKPNQSQVSGIQCKGCSEDVTIEKCDFVNAGQRRSVRWDWRTSDRPSRSTKIEESSSE